MVAKSRTSVTATGSVWSNGLHSEVESTFEYSDIFPEDGSLGIAGLNWRVEKRDVFDQDGNECDKGGGIFRTDTNDFFGFTGARYAEIQNYQGLGLFKPWMQDRRCGFEQAFTYGHNGCNVVAVLNCVDSGVEIVQGDKHIMYMMVHLTHNGTGSVRAFPVDYRIACCNAMPGILSRKDTGITVRVRHSGNVEYKLEEAMRVLEQADERFKRMIEWQKQLVEIGTTPELVREVIELVIPETIKNQDGKGKTQRDNKIMGLLTSVAKEQILLPQWTNTSGGQNAYALFNGFTRFVDHEVGGRKSNRAEYALVGTGLDMKQDAIAAISKVFNVKHPAKVEVA